MPITTNITLGIGQIIIQEIGSVSGIISTDGKTQFGQVIMVYAGSDKTTAGTYVLFETSKARRLIYGSTQYIILNEADIAGTETSIP